MSDFNRAMSQMLAVFTQDLGSKVTVQEIEGMPRLGFLAIPGTEYSDRIYSEFYPRKETKAVIKATEYLKKVAADRRNPSASKPSGKFSLSEFTTAMSEVLKIFTEDLGGNVSIMELGSNLRLSILARSGVEHSDLLYKEFYPRRETAELKKTITVLKGIAQRRGAGSSGMGGGAGYGSIPAPKRREPHTIYTSYSKPVTPAKDVSRFYSPAKPLVKKPLLDSMVDVPSPAVDITTKHMVRTAVLDTMADSPAPPQAIQMEAGSTLMVFDYVSFTMKPVGSFI